MLGSRIAVLRRAKGWSQSELARRLQVSPSAVGMYEQGRREPALDILVAMARIFGVTTDYLLTGKPVCETDHTAFSNAFLQSLDAAQSLSAARRDRAFSRQELAVLMAAMLMEP